MEGNQLEEPVSYTTSDGEEKKSDFSFGGEPGFDIDDEDWYKNLKLNNNRRRFYKSPTVTNYRMAVRYRRPCWVRNSKGYMYKIK